MKKKAAPKKKKAAVVDAPQDDLQKQVDDLNAVETCEYFINDEGAIAARKKEKS